jgi:hypothetical protein
MSPVIIGVIGFVFLFIVLFLLRVPIGIGMGLVGFMAGYSEDRPLSDGSLLYPQCGSSFYSDG